MRPSAIASFVLSGVLLAALPEGGAAQGAAAECVQETNGESSMHPQCWDGGKRRGRWVIRLADGGVQEGPYVAGEKQGRWVLRHADGTVEEGPVVAGVRQGGWVAHRPDGSRRAFEMDGGALVAGSVRVASRAKGREAAAATRAERRPVQSAPKASEAAPAAAQQNDGPPLWSLFGSSYQPSNAARIMEALHKGADPNARDGSGNTSVHYAAAYHVDVLRAVIAHGGPCTQRNSLGTTPLHVAAAQGTIFGAGPEGVRILLDCGASSNARDDLGNTPLHALYEGVRNGLGPPSLPNVDSHPFGGGRREDVLEALLEGGADPNIKNKAGDTPMMVMLKDKLVYSPLPHLRLFLKHGADADTVDGEGVPAVSRTILVRDDEDYCGKLVAALLEAGADPDKPDRRRDTPLIHAVKQEHDRSNCVAALLKGGADPDMADRRGDTPLIHVAKSEDDAYVDALLAAGADPCIADRDRYLPSDHAPKGSYRRHALIQAGGVRDVDVDTGQSLCRRDMLAAGDEKALALGRDERRRIQSCLKAQGHDPGSADGVFGPRTRAAIRGWQAAKGGGAPAPGYLTRAHADTLLSACRVAAEPEPACTGKERGEGEGCWMELANQRGCWIWNPHPQPEETVTWSGGCSDGKASGKGEEVWRFRKGGEWKTSAGKGELRGGKTRGGHWVERFSNGRVWEGPYVDGRPHGLWVRRGSDGRDWQCRKNGERVEGDRDCVAAEDLAMQASASGARVRSGPGEEYEELGRLAEGEKVKVTGGAVGGAWMRVEAPGDGLRFVQASKLEEAAGASWNVGEVFRDCAECPELVVVPSGSFLMGSSASEEGRFYREGPVHRVEIGEPFAVGIYEVTFREWDACVAEGGCDGHRPVDEGWGRGKRPVINVSWEDAKAYVRWLSRKTGEAYRLLSEAEWEYVARGGTRTRYWWGDEIGRNRANCAGCGRSRWETAPVGSFAANPFGLHDVHGNAWEWVEDCWNGSYREAPSDGSSWESGDCSLRVLRGGSCVSGPRGLRSALRVRDPTGSRSDYVGFRVARTLD